MYILHLSATPLAGAYIRLSKLLNKYSNVTSKCVGCLPTSIKFPEPDFKVEYHYVFRNTPVFHESEILKEEIKKADIIHIHNYPPIPKNSETWSLLGKKPIVLQFHSPPHICNPRYEFITQKVKVSKVLIIAQYQAYVLNYPNKVIVRNAIDIFDKYLMPEIKENNPPLITYAPSNTRGPEMEWAYKSYNEIKALFDEIKSNFNCKMLINVPHQNSLELRKSANIHIDEISTGSYHLTSLEAMSQGTVPIANLADWMQKIIREKTGADYLPWLICNKNNIKQKIYDLCYDKDNLLNRQKLSRKWMETFWAPKLILNDYLSIYRSL